MDSDLLDYLHGLIPVENMTVEEMDKLIRKSLVLSLLSFMESMNKLITARSRLLMERGVNMDINTNVSMLDDGVILTISMRVKGYDVERLKEHIKYFIRKGPYSNYEKTLFYTSVMHLYKLQAGEEKWDHSTQRGEVTRSIYAESSTRKDTQ